MSTSTMKMQLLNIVIALATMLGGLTRTEGRSDILSIDLDVPPWAKAGSTVSMSCKYDVGGEPVYQVKWYKGTKEFFRYTPRESPTVKIFMFPGLQIDASRSNGTIVTLKKLDLSMKGTYSCEVSTDAPDFLTDIKSATLDVVAVPESNPIITELKPTYSVNDIVEANCTIYRSKPTAILTWYINSEKAHREYLVPPGGLKIKENSTETSQLNLRFQLGPNHFEHGRATLKCTAKIADYYDKSSEVTISEDDKPKLSSIVDNNSSSGSSSNTQAQNFRLPDLPLRRYFKGATFLFLLAVVVPHNFLMPIILIS